MLITNSICKSFTIFWLPISTNLSFSCKYQELFVDNKSLFFLRKFVVHIFLCKSSLQNMAKVFIKSHSNFCTFWILKRFLIFHILKHWRWGYFLSNFQRITKNVISALNYFKDCGKPLCLVNCAHINYLHWFWKKWHDFWQENLL